MKPVISLTWQRLSARQRSHAQEARAVERQELLQCPPISKVDPLHSHASEPYSCR